MNDALRGLIAHLSALPPGRRLVAIAGPPAAGKSTVTAPLAAALTAAGRPAQVVAMDGFHLDNATLDARGLSDRKGAPETFDVAGLHTLLRAIAAGGHPAPPTFDRSRDATRPGTRPFDAEIALVEGNWLLLDEDPWRALHPLWDATVRLDVPEPVLRARLLKRWRIQGLPPAAAAARTDGNDMPNARRMVAGSRPADHVIRAVG